jgi:hypothetical protein
MKILSALSTQSWALDGAQEKMVVLNYADPPAVAREQGFATVASSR